jgi:hypothetical protein
MNCSRVTVLPLLLGVLLPASGRAQDTELRRHLRDCSRITVRAERLRCFDAIITSMTSGPGDSTGALELWRTGGTGDWVVDEAINPLDDSQLVVLSLKASSGSAPSGEPVELVLRCLSGKTDVYVHWNVQLGKDGAAVAMRIGSQPAQTRRWNLSTDMRETFYPADAIAFIKQLIEVDRFVAQVVPAGEGPITAVFRLRGLGVAAGPLREVCKW